MRKKCPKNHLMDLREYDLFWWCDKCEKHYSMNKVERDMFKAGVEFGIETGECKLQRKLQNLLGLGVD